MISLTQVAGGDMDVFTWKNLLICTPTVDPLCACILSFHFLKIISKGEIFFVVVFVSQGCCNKVPQIGWLQQQKVIVSQFWLLEVQNRGVGRVMFPLKPVGKNPSSPLPSFCWWPLIPGIPWLIDASLSFLPPSSCGVLTLSLLSYMEFLL